MSDSKRLAGMVEKCGGDGYAERTLAREQPCGCLVCICEDEEHCHGCGARFCGNHFSHVDRIPNPKWIEDTPKPLAENLAWLEGWLRKQYLTIHIRGDSRGSMWRVQWLNLFCYLIGKAHNENEQTARILAAIEAAEKCLGRKP